MLAQCLNREADTAIVPCLLTVNQLINSIHATTGVERPMMTASGTIAYFAALTLMLGLSVIMRVVLRGVKLI